MTAPSDSNSARETAEPSGNGAAPDGNSNAGVLAFNRADFPEPCAACEVGAPFSPHPDQHPARKKMRTPAARSSEVNERMSELGLGQHPLADESLRATKRSERCDARIQRGVYREYICALKKGHPTKHVAQFRAGAYRWSYEEVWGEGTNPFPPVVLEDAPCDKCGGTGVMQRVKPEGDRQEGSG